MLTSVFIPVVYLFRGKEYVLVFEFVVPKVEDDRVFMPTLRTAVKPSGDAIGVLPPDYSHDKDLFEKLVVDVQGIRQKAGDPLTKEQKVGFVNTLPGLRRQALAALFSNFEVVHAPVEEGDELVIDTIGRTVEDIEGVYRVYDPSTKETEERKAQFKMSVPSELQRMEYFSKSYGEVNPKEKSWKKVDDYAFLERMYSHLVISEPADMRVSLFVKAAVLEELFTRVNLKND